MCPLELADMRALHTSQLCIQLVYTWFVQAWPLRHTTAAALAVLEALAARRGRVASPRVLPVESLDRVRDIC